MAARQAPPGGFASTPHTIAELEARIHRAIEMVHTQMPKEELGCLLGSDRRAFLFELRKVLEGRV